MPDLERILSPFLGPPAEFGRRFEQGWLSRKAARRIAQFLDKQGEENVRWLMETKTDIVSLIPPETLKAYREKAASYHWALGKVTPAGVWRNFDPRWKEVILSYPEGQQWALAQMRELLEVFVGGEEEAS